MIYNTKQKIFIWLSISVFMLFSAQPAFAQLGGLDVVPTSNTALGTGGLAGQIENSAAETVFQSAFATNEGCVKAEEAYGKTDHVVEFAFGGLSLISGGKAELARLEEKTKVIEGFISCRERVKDILKGMITPNLITSQKKQRINDEVDIAINTLKKRKDDLQAQSRTAKRGFWKTVVVNVLLKTTKNVASHLTKSMTRKFKISDYDRYIDTVGSTVYTSQLIKNSSNDKRDQMLYRSILQKSQDTGKIPPAAVLGAEEFVGFEPNQKNISDPDFYVSMAKVGNSQAQPYFRHIEAVEKSYSMNAKGQESAKKEVEQSSGFKAPRNCSGSLATQRQIDRDYALLEKEFEDRYELYQSLNQAKLSGEFAGQELATLEQDLKKAQDDLADISERLNGLPNQFDSPVLTICETIVSPASLVDKGVDNAFGQFAKNLGDYNENNLPYFINFISEIANGISNDLIYGGSLKNSLLSESRNLESLAGAGASYAVSQAKADAQKKNLESGVSFTYDTTDKPGEFILYWDVVKDQDKAKSVLISGPAADTGPQPIEGSMRVSASTGGTYRIRVFDGSGKEMFTGTIVVNSEDISGSSSGTQNQGTLGVLNNSPSVLGVTLKSPTLLRGSQPLKLRGAE